MNIGGIFLGLGLCYFFPHLWPAGVFFVLIGIIAAPDEHAGR